MSGNQRGGTVSQDTHTQRTLLVVEDDSVLYESIRLHFERHGWKCAWYDHAPADMDEVRALGADAGLIDVNLPAGNGIDLINCMRADGIDMPIIVMTGYIGAAERARSSGISNMEVLLKPFDLRKLQDKLSDAMFAAA
ncbi:MAG: response regulator [Alphaproteobacteria bacterium]|nr:response regulator [Alphaproteobacteria bacterium]